MTNKQIRKQSYKVYKFNIWHFLRVNVIFIIPSFIILVINGTIDHSLKYIFVLLITIINYPLSLGVTRYYFKEFHGENSFIGDIFYYYKGQRLLNSFILGTLISVINFAFNRSLDYFQELSKKYFFLLLPYTLIALITIYILYRLFLVPYFCIYSIHKNPLLIVKESIKKTKGFFISKVIFDFSIYFIPIIVVGIVSGIIIISELMNSTQLLSGIIYIVFLPFAPYINLSLAGFATRIIPTQTSNPYYTDREKDMGERFSELSDRLHGLGFTGEAVPSSMDIDMPEQPCDAFSNGIPGIQEDFDSEIDMEMPLEYDCFKQKYVELTPNEYALKEMYQDGEKLPSQEFSIKDTTQELHNYNILKLLEQIDLPIFLKSDEDIRSLFIKTYHNAMKELGYYEGNQRKATIANIIMLHHNEFRIMITLQESILEHQIDIGFWINEWN